MRQLAITLFCLLAVSQSAYAAPEWVRVPCKVVTFPLCIVGGAHVGAFIGPFVGGFTGLGCWASYWSTSDQIHAAEVEMKREQKEAEKAAKEAEKQKAFDDAELKAAVEEALKSLK